MKRILGIIASAVLVAVVCAPVARAGTVDWTAFSAALTLADDTTLAPAGTSLKLGNFTLSDATITADANNPSALAAGFSQIQAGAVGDIAGVPNGFNGIWSEEFNGDFTAGAAAFAGKTIYLWASTGSQQAVIKFSAAFPTDSPAPGSASVDLGQVYASAATVLIGSTSGTTVFQPQFSTQMQHVDMAAIVPEPSTVVLVGLGLLGMVGLRRRR